ncbi:hypothetical protein RB195_003989 [Necator americanus]|uniref:ShKT domain-containing protein n=1 Tax=Necator americanus TaxID=51031 RepID=A0ABR1DRD4_NECAM
MYGLTWVLLVITNIGVSGRITDLNCTKKMGVLSMYAENAVNCKNRYSDSACLFLYTTAVREGEGFDRNPRCFQNPKTGQVDYDLVQMAVNSCPKTCGYCCKTPEFSCENKRNPRIDCTKVTKEHCRSQIWRPILMEDCPKVCGLCREFLLPIHAPFFDFYLTWFRLIFIASDSGCVDLAPGCGLDPDICKRPEMNAFVKISCRSTCRLCSMKSAPLSSALIEALLGILATNSGPASILSLLNDTHGKTPGNLTAHPVPRNLTTGSSPAPISSLDITRGKTPGNVTAHPFPRFPSTNSSPAPANPLLSGTHGKTPGNVTAHPILWNLTNDSSPAPISSLDITRGKTPGNVTAHPFPRFLSTNSSPAPISSLNITRGKKPGNVTAHPILWNLTKDSSPAPISSLDITHGKTPGNVTAHPFPRFLSTNSSPAPANPLLNGTHGKIPGNVTVHPILRNLTNDSRPAPLNVTCGKAPGNITVGPFTRNLTRDSRPAPVKALLNGTHGKTLGNVTAHPFPRILATESSPRFRNSFHHLDSKQSSREKRMQAEQNNKSNSRTASKPKGGGGGAAASRRPMLSLIWLLAVTMNIDVNGRITDLNCTRKIGRESVYTESAVNCENRFSESACLFMYTAAVREGESMDRNPKCFQHPRTRQVDFDLVQMAVDSCPKTCGYCCKTPEFSCENRKNPRINCTKVTKVHCRSQLWRRILAEDCPNVCGFCGESGCIDLAPGCAVDPNLCKRSEMDTFVKINCRRTCGLCSKRTITFDPALIEALLNATNGMMPGSAAADLLAGILTTNSSTTMIKQ